MTSERSDGPLILASASPRRREILSSAEVAFEVVESGLVEKMLPDEPARDFAIRMAIEKAMAVSKLRADALVLGADTIVEIDGRVLGKPRDRDDARAMLNSLSSRTHNVITAFALARRSRVIDSDAVLSRVTFRHLSPGEISEYVESEEPYDKAGAYAVQGIAGDFIVKIDGSRSNVMGLPREEVLEAIERARQHG
jgi:septum formation protein